MRVLWPVSLLLFVAGYLVRAAWPVPTLDATVIGAGFLALAGVLAWSVTFGRHRLESFLKGARGEEWVARSLSFLPASYRIYHGLTSADGKLGADYDHVVVGPTGIFLIETKNWNGRISVRDGRVLYDGMDPYRPPLDQVKNAAVQLRRELREQGARTAEVYPILCFAQGQIQDGRIGAAGVSICTVDLLCEVLQETSDDPPSRTVQEQAIYYLNRRSGVQA